MRIVLFALAITCLSACGFVGFPGVYRIDVEQGNIVTQDIVDQLQPGMSRRQVRFIMGTPLVEDSFNRDRWDYLYNRRNGLDVLDNSNMTVIFEGDALSEVRGDYLPPAFGGTTDDAADKAAEPEAEASVAENDSE